MLRKIRETIEIDNFRLFIIGLSALIFLANYFKNLPDSITTSLVLAIIVACSWAIYRAARHIDTRHLLRWQNALGIITFALGIISSVLWFTVGLQGGEIGAVLWSVGDGTLIESLTFITFVGALFIKSG